MDVKETTQSCQWTSHDSQGQRDEFMVAAFIAETAQQWEDLRAVALALLREEGASRPSSRPCTPSPPFSTTRSFFFFSHGKCLLRLCAHAHCLAVF
jgi:hypothetical protein